MHYYLPYVKNISRIENCLFWPIYSWNEILKFSILYMEDKKIFLLTLCWAKCKDLMGKSKREEEYSILITCCDIICTVEFLQQDFSIKFPDIVAYNVCKILCNCAIVFLYNLQLVG